MKRVLILIALMGFYATPAHAATDLGLSFCHSAGPGFPPCSDESGIKAEALELMAKSRGCWPFDGQTCTLVQGQTYDWHFILIAPRSNGGYPVTVTATAFFVPTNDGHFVNWSNVIVTGLCQQSGHDTGF